MKAVVMRAHGEPGVLRLEDWPMPQIAADEVLLKVGACGVPYHDIVERNGTYKADQSFPVILGYEIAGTVERVGSLVRTIKPGDRVCCKVHHSCGMCRFCRNSMETACPSRKSVHGGYAEYVALAEEVLVRLPDEIDFPVACMLAAATGVALNAVRDAAKVKLNETVLVTGASGGLGLPSIELAKVSGASVIAVTRSPAKAQDLRDTGADHVIVAEGRRDFSADVMALTDGLGVDVVIDNVGSAVFTPCFKSLAMGGRYAFVGQLFKEQISINPARIFFRRAHLIGVGSVRRDQLEDAVRLTAAGKIHPRVACILPLSAIAEAHAMVEAGNVVGRVVVQP
jgi:acryloyl-coenzyme A reductase